MNVSALCLPFNADLLLPLVLGQSLPDQPVILASEVSPESGMNQSLRLRR